MKYWLSDLPLEVWVDVYRYPWIKREELGRIVDRFCNRKYDESLQFYLHDWGKRKLKHLYIDKNGLYKNSSVSIQSHPTDSNPSNIRAFEFIQISHFDQQTIDFLHRIQPLLLADTKLEFRDIRPWNLGNLRTILDHLVPLLGGIDSLKFNMLALPVVQQCLGNEKLSKVINAIEPESEVMTQATVNFLMTWLTIPAQQEGNGNGPRWCELCLIIDDGFSEQFCAAIRQDFLAAKSPSTFALVVHPSFSLWEFAGFHLQNGIGEELHGVKLLWHNDFRITRHQANCGTQMEEWIQEIETKRYNTGKHNQIAIISPTIGQIDAMDAIEDGHNDKQKPSSSKNV